MFATINGCSIHYKRTGSGTPPFLLVHGWGGSGRSLESLTQLVAENHTAYTIDLPGFGASGMPGGEWGVEEYASVVARFIEQKIGAPVVYFGHSFGGALGIRIAADRPDLVSGLVLAAPSFHRTARTSRPTAGAINRLPLPPFVKLLLRKIFYRLFYPRSDILNYPRLEHNYRKIVSTDLTPLLEKIRKAPLILWGGNDRDTPVGDAYLLEKGIPGSTLVVVKDATHNLPLKNPELVLREMEKFL